MDDRALAQLAISLLDLTDLAADASEAGADDLCRTGSGGRDGGGVRVAGVRRPLRRTAGRHRCAGGDGASTSRPATNRLDRVAAVAAAAVAGGADELDVVLPYRAWLAGDEATAAAVLAAVRDERRRA